MDFELAKTERHSPYNGVEKFPYWAKKCIEKYVRSGTLEQIFKISHAAMIFESLWMFGLRPREGWLLDAAESVLYFLEKFDTTGAIEEKDQRDENILAIILCIREYFIINNCYDPHSSLTEVGKIWVEPEHLPEYYLDQLHAITERLAS